MDQMRDMQDITIILVFQGDILAQIRDLILQCDQTMRNVTVAYFQLQHTVTAPLPVQVI